MTYILIWKLLWLLHINLLLIHHVSLLILLDITSKVSSLRLRSRVTVIAQITISLLILLPIRILVIILRWAERMLILNGQLVNSMEVIRSILIGIWIWGHSIVKSRVLLLSKMRDILKEMLPSIFRLGFYFGGCSKWVIMEILLLADVFVGLV